MLKCVDLEKQNSFFLSQNELWDDMRTYKTKLKTINLSLGFAISHFCSQSEIFKVIIRVVAVGLVSSLV